MNVALAVGVALPCIILRILAPHSVQYGEEGRLVRRIFVRVGLRKVCKVVEVFLRVAFKRCRADWNCEVLNESTKTVDMLLELL